MDGFRLTSTIYALGGLVGTGLLVVGLAWLGYAIWRWRRLGNRQLVTLQLTPPANTARAPEATTGLFSVIHGLRTTRRLSDRLLGRQPVVAFEIVSTRDEGIRFLIQTDLRAVAAVRQAVTAYLPHLRITEIGNDPPPVGQVREFKQRAHYAFPLAASPTLAHHDPLAYITVATANLAADEAIRLQLIVKPIQPRSAAFLGQQLRAQEDVLNQLQRRQWSGPGRMARVVSSSLFAVLDLLAVFVHGPSHDRQQSAFDRQQFARHQRPARTISGLELDLLEQMHAKLSLPLFQATLRVGVSGPDQTRSANRLHGLQTALQVYSVAGYQGFQMRHDLPITRPLRAYAWRHRLPSLQSSQSCILSAAELASLYHFPLGTHAQTDNLITSLSRTLPAPVSLKQATPPALVLGMNDHHGVRTPIGLSESERERHVYIIGGTGNGKTTLLQYQIVQDMQQGKGLAVVDPHGDLADSLLRQIPPDRIADVIYFNPDDLDYPFGLNLLELTPGLKGTALLREKDLIAESVVSVFRKLFSDDEAGGHRIEYILRNAIHTALTVPDATLFTVYDLLNNPPFRKAVVTKLEDDNLRNFWQHEFGKAGNMQKVKMAAGITAKIGRFLFSASARQILEQPKSTIDFDDIMSSGKILICNCSKGLLGEDAAELFGITILAKLQLASLRRARLAAEDRRPFYLYVDEFQNFATPAFVQMLSESRKYKLFLTMAEQSTSQQADQRTVSIILANVGTVICFRTGNPDDERLLLPLFTPYIEPGELANQPPFQFYAKLAAITAQEPLSGHTILLESTGNEDTARQVIDHSRQQYGRAVPPPAANKQPPKTVPAVTQPVAPGKQVVMLDEV